MVLLKLLAIATVALRVGWSSIKGCIATVAN
jgi:hypothetical protein